MTIFCLVAWMTKFVWWGSSEKTTLATSRKLYIWMELLGKKFSRFVWKWSNSAIIFFSSNFFEGTALYGFYTSSLIKWTSKIMGWNQQKQQNSYKYVFYLNPMHLHLIDWLSRWYIQEEGYRWIFSEYVVRFQSSCWHKVPVGFVAF